MRHEFRDLGDFAARFGPEIGSFVSKFDVTVRKLSIVHISAGIQIRLPRRTGALAESLSVRMPTRDNFGLIQMSEAYAQIYAKGRRRSKPYRRALSSHPKTAERGRRGSKLGSGGTKEFTRMLGSKQAQARRGWKPALTQFRKEFPDIVIDAARYAEAA